MRTGPTNPNLRNLIAELKKLSIEQKVDIWKRIASDLERPTRDRRVVNISTINRFVNNNETIIVPGKVLASGPLDKKTTIVAQSFSLAAAEKIKDSGSEIMTIQELMKKNPKGKDIRIIG